MHRDMRRRGGRVQPKFAPPPTPFQQEAKIPEMEPLPWVVSDAMRAYASAEEDIVPGFQDYIAQELLKDQEELTRKNFVLEFKAWLRGVSRYNFDHAVTPWGTDHLMHLPGVTDMFDAELKQYYDFKTALLKLATWGPTNLNDAFLYYKYIVLPLWAARVDPSRDCRWFDHDGRQMFLDHCSYKPFLVVREDGEDMINPDLNSAYDDYPLNVELAVGALSGGMDGILTIDDPYNPARYVDSYQEAVNAYYDNYDSQEVLTEDDKKAEKARIGKRALAVLDSVVFVQPRIKPVKGVEEREHLVNGEAVWLNDVRDKIKRSQSIKYFKKFKNTLKMGDVLRDIINPPQVIPNNGPYIENVMVPRSLASQTMPIGSALMAMDAPPILSNAVGNDRAPAQPPPRQAPVDAPPVVKALIQSVPRTTYTRLDVDWSTERSIQANITIVMDKLRDSVYNQFETAIAMVQRFDDYTRWMDTPEAMQDQRVARARQQYLERRNTLVEQLHNASMEVKHQLEDDEANMYHAAMTYDATGMATRFFASKGIQTTTNRNAVRAAIEQYAAANPEEYHTEGRYTFVAPQLALALFGEDGTEVAFVETVGEETFDRAYYVYSGDVQSISLAKTLGTDYSTGAEIVRTFLPWANEYSDLLLVPVKPGAETHIENPEEAEWPRYQARVNEVFKELTRSGDEDERVSNSPAYRTYKNVFVPMYKEMIARGMYVADRLLLTQDQHDATTATYNALMTMIELENMKLVEASHLLNVAINEEGEWDNGDAVRALMAASKGTLDMMGSISTVVNGTVASAALALGEAIQELEEANVDASQLKREYEALVVMLGEDEQSVRQWIPSTFGGSGGTDDSGRVFRALQREATAATVHIELENAQTYLTLARDWQLRQLQLLLQLNTGSGQLLNPEVSALMAAQRAAYAQLTGIPTPQYSPVQFVQPDEPPPPLPRDEVTDRPPYPLPANILPDGSQRPPMPLPGDIPPRPTQSLPGDDDQPRTVQPAPTFGLFGTGAANAAELEDDDIDDMVVSSQIRLPIPPPPPPPSAPAAPAPVPPPPPPGTPVPAVVKSRTLRAKKQRTDADGVPVRTNDLLASIKAGTKLKKVEPQKKKDTNPNSIVNLLSNAFTSRRAALADDDDDDDDSKDDDDDWGDDDPMPVASTTTTSSSSSTMRPATTTTTTTTSSSTPRPTSIPTEQLRQLLGSTKQTQELLDRYQESTAAAQDQVTRSLQAPDGSVYDADRMAAHYGQVSDTEREVLRSYIQVAPAMLYLQSNGDAVSLRRIFTQMQNTAGTSIPEMSGVGVLSINTPYVSNATAPRLPGQFQDMYSYTVLRNMAQSLGVDLPVEAGAYPGNRLDYAMIDGLMRNNKPTGAAAMQSAAMGLISTQFGDLKKQISTKQGMQRLLSEVPTPLLMHVMHALTKDQNAYLDQETVEGAVARMILRTANIAYPLPALPNNTTIGTHSLQSIPVLPVTRSDDAVARALFPDVMDVEDPEFIQHDDAANLLAFARELAGRELILGERLSRSLTDSTRYALRAIDSVLAPVGSTGLVPGAEVLYKKLLDYQDKQYTPEQRREMAAELRATINSILSKTGVIVALRQIADRSGRTVSKAI